MATALDFVHTTLPNPASDQNTYTLGKMGRHNSGMGARLSDRKLCEFGDLSGIIPAR
jgi:hypothetical protein